MVRRRIGGGRPGGRRAAGYFVAVRLREGDAADAELAFELGNAISAGLTDALAAEVPEPLRGPQHEGGGGELARWGGARGQQRRDLGDTAVPSQHRSGMGCDGEGIGTGYCWGVQWGEKAPRF